MASTSRVLPHAGRDRHHAADAGRLRARHHGVELGREIGKIEMAMAVDEHGRSRLARRFRFRLDIAREHRRRARGRVGAAARCGWPAAERARSRRSPAGMPSRSSSFAGRCWHERLSQDRDLPDHLGGDVEHRALPRRIGLGERPRRLAREIAVGVGHHGPDRVEHLVQLLASSSPRAPCRSWRRRRRGSPGRLAENAPGFGSTPPNCLADHGQRALRQIAEIVGEVGIDAR